MISDPEITKRLTYKMINRSRPAQLRLQTQNDAINTTGLAAARCDTSTAAAARGQELCLRQALSQSALHSFFECCSWWLKGCRSSLGLTVPSCCLSVLAGRKCPRGLTVYQDNVAKMMCVSIVETVCVYVLLQW